MNKTFKKIALLILKAVKWPALYLLPPVIVTFLIHIFSGNRTLEQTLGSYSILLVLIVFVLAFAEGIISSLFFTEHFLVSTGIAAGMFLLVSLFINNPDPDWSDFVEYDTIKMMMCFILILMVFLGDLSVLGIRKIRKNKRNKTPEQ